MHLLIGSRVRGIFFLVGGFFFAVLSIGMLLVESLALWLIKWNSFGRSLLGVFLMNLASNVVGFMLFGLSNFGVNHICIFS